MHFLQPLPIDEHMEPDNYDTNPVMYRYVLRSPLLKKVQFLVCGETVMINGHTINEQMSITRAREVWNDLLKAGYVLE